MSFSLWSDATPLLGPRYLVIPRGTLDSTPTLYYTPWTSSFYAAPCFAAIYIYIYIYILCHMVLNTAKRGGEHTQREREIDERRSPALDLRAGSFLGIPALFCGAAPYHRMISSFPFCCGWRCAVSLVHRGGVCINIYGCCVGWCAAHTHKPKRQPLFFSFPPVWCVPSFLPTPTLTMHMSLYCAPLILFGAPLLPAYDIQGAA